MTQGIKVGVLALQGAFYEHEKLLSACGAEPVEVRTRADLAGLAGLIIPGGESTAISLLLQKADLFEELKQRGQAGLPMFGTCAGLIMLARQVEGDPPPTLALMDIRVKRNAYGRQVESFTTSLAIPVLGESAFPAVFIRAPQIAQIGPKLEVLAYEGRRPVLVRQGNLLAASFHPELTRDLRIYRYFLAMLGANA